MMRKNFFCDCKALKAFSSSLADKSMLYMPDKNLTLFILIVLHVHDNVALAHPDFFIYLIIIFLVTAYEIPFF